MVIHVHRPLIGLLLVCCMLLLAVSAGCSYGSPPQTGHIEGQVTIGPLCPVEPCNVSAEQLAQAYAARKIEVYTEDKSRLIKEVPINASGWYEATVVHGTYFVDVNPVGIGGSSGVPALVTVRSGETVRLDISIDTGIR